jgi:F-type H+-transporting ATPase subunit a
MLGHNLPLKTLVPQTANINLWPSNPYIGGNLGEVHADTIGLAWVCMGLILVWAVMARSTLTASGPGGPLQAMAEGFFKAFEGLCKQNMGHEYKPFVKLIAGIFIFVLIANFIGVGPWKVFEGTAGWPTIHGEPLELASPTTDFNVTLGLALIALFTYLGAGFWAHGFGYLKLYLNPIEWLDFIIRPATLALRLMMVITADELMRAAALMMIPFVLPAFVMGFEMFIGVIQAFVFALLTSIYIGLTVQHH